MINGPYTIEVRKFDLHQCVMKGLKVNSYKVMHDIKEITVTIQSQGDYI